MTKGLQRPILGVRLSEAGIRSVVCRLRERERERPNYSRKDKDKNVF